MLQLRRHRILPLLAFLNVLFCLRPIFLATTFVARRLRLVARHIRGVGWSGILRLENILGRVHFGVLGPRHHRLEIVLTNRRQRIILDDVFGRRRLTRPRRISNGGRDVDLT